MPRIGIDAHLLSFVASYRQAGVSQYIARLLEAFAATPPSVGARSFVAFTGPHRPPGGFARSARITWRHSLMPTERAVARIAWEQVTAPVLVKRERLDLWHGPVNILPLASPCPGVVTVHDLAFLALPDAFEPFKRRYLATFTRASCRRARRVIAVSRHTASELVTRLGLAEDAIDVVHNGVTPNYRPLAPDAVARFRAGQRLPDQSILFVGTLEPRKNLAGLLYAFATVAAESEATLVVVGGRGWLFDDTLALVSRLGLAKRVRFEGHVRSADLPLWYNAARVVVYPSLYEGFGLPPLEALACGAVVVTSDGSALPEVVGDAALMVDVRDPAALAAALLRALRDENLRATMSDRGPRQAARFSWARTAAATEAVYARALSATTPSMSPRGGR